MSTSLQEVAEGRQVPVVMCVDVVSRRSQPRIVLLVEITLVAVVLVTDTPNDVVVRKIVADLVSHDVGSSE